MTSLTIRAIPCESAVVAIQEADVGGQGAAVLVDGQPMVVPQDDLDRLAAAEVAFAYLCRYKTPDGSWRIMTVPVN